MSRASALRLASQLARLRPSSTARISVARYSSIPPKNQADLPFGTTIDTTTEGSSISSNSTEPFSPSPSNKFETNAPNISKPLQSKQTLAEDPSTLITLTHTPAPHTGQITTLTLNRPAKKNALSKALVHSLEDALHNQIQRFTKGSKTPHGTRVLIIESAAEGAFCAGADLAERRGMNDDQVREFLGRLRGALKTIQGYGIPVIAAVDGVAMGGGLELALACTFRVMSRDAKVALPEAKIGIIPGAGGTYRLGEVVGRNRALEMMLTGRVVTGEELERSGLADRLVDGDAKGAAKRFAEEICRSAPLSVNTLMKLHQVPPREEMENRMYEYILTRAADRIEGLASFREKRSPAFKGEELGEGVE